VEQGITGYDRYFDDPENRTTWSENSVRMILRSPVYAGNLTGYKRPAVSMKSKKRPSRLPEEWETVQGTHEGIVSQEDFDVVQELITGRRGKGQSGYDNIFSGIIKCADCGYHLSAGSANRRKRPDILDCVVYSCGNYTRYGVHTCSSHSLEVGGILYTEKAEAGKAIIEACKSMTSPDPVPMGEYRGFQMIMSFDTFSKEYKVTMSGALSHTVKLGTDIHGNITRLDNALDGLANSLQNCENNLADTQKQLSSAQGEVSRVFPQEQEYADKSARLRELNSLLNMDEKDNTILEYAPDEGDVERAPKAAERER